MARLPRYVIPGQAQHIIQRSQNRRIIFKHDADFQFYRDAIIEASGRAGLAIHAYALMPDQTHFLATPTEGDSVGRTLQLAAGNYVQYFNDTYRREGTIWEGRYRATVVESKRYLLTVMRYIESNVVCAPSRAKSAAKSVPKSSVAIRVAGPILGSIAPRDYLWSSHKRNAYGDAGPNSNWLVAADEYQQLGVDEPSRQRAYRDLFKRALAESDAALIGESAHKGWALGDAKFQTAIAELSGRRATRGARGRPRLPD